MRRDHFQHHGHANDALHHHGHPSDALHHHDPRGFRPGFGPGFGPGADWAGPWAGQGGRRRPKGDVRAAILSLLSESGPLNGYAMMKAVGEKTDGAWRVSPGSMYPTLQQLVDEGLIASRGEGRTTVFELTDDGRSYVAENAEELDKAWNAVPRPSESATELFESIGKLMGVVGQFKHAATDEQRKAAVEKIDEARRALYLILAE